MALAARAKGDEHMGIEGWLAPLKKKLLEAKKAGASFDELKQMMLEARLNTHALAGAMAENIRQVFYGDEDELEAANPYGCNQYGEGWRMPHNGKQAAKGKCGKVTLDASYVEPYSDKSYIVRKTRNGKGIYVPAKLCKFDGEKCEISVPPDSDLSDKLKKFEDETEDTHKAVDLDDKVRESIWKRINDREEAGEEFDSDEEFDRIYDAHQEEREEKYWEARQKALDSGVSDAEAYSRARKARQKADEDFLRDFAENLQAASADDKRLDEPVPQPDGTSCYTKNCSRHNNGKAEADGKQGEQSVIADNKSNGIVEIKIVPELEQFGVPKGKVKMKKKLAGKFLVKGRVSNKKKVISVLRKLLTKPFKVSGLYQEKDKHGKTHDRIDIYKETNGRTMQITLEASGEYAGGIVTFIRNLSANRIAEKTKGLSTIR